MTPNHRNTVQLLMHVEMDVCSVICKHHHKANAQLQVNHRLSAAHSRAWAACFAFFTRRSDCESNDMSLPILTPRAAGMFVSLAYSHLPRHDPGVTSLPIESASGQWNVWRSLANPTTQPQLPSGAAASLCVEYCLVTTADSLSTQHLLMRYPQIRLLEAN